MQVVRIDSIVRPAEPEGDAFYGLETGTNGTGAAMRRKVAAPPGCVWQRHDGKPAMGLLLTPTNRSAFVPNPWDGVL